MRCSDLTGHACGTEITNSVIREIVIKVLYYLLVDMRWCTIVWKQHCLFCPQRNILRSALFWDVMQHRTVILYWHFRTNCWSHLQGTNSPGRLPGTFRYAHTIPYMNCVTWMFLEFLDCLTLEDGTDKFSYIGMELPFYTAYHPRRAQISLRHSVSMKSRTECLVAGVAVLCEIHIGSFNHLYIPQWQVQLCNSQWYHAIMNVIHKNWHHAVIVQYIEI